MKSVALGFALLSLACATACANNKDSGEELTHSDTGTGLGGEIGPGLDASTDTKIDPDAACGTTTEKATLTPVNLYVMFDKSQSMGPLKTSTKWAGARKGMEAFVKDPTSAGLRIAIKFFPLNVAPTPACSSTPYATPVVPFDVLPKNADPVLAAIDAESPDGFTTPMYPALLGALNGTINEVKGRPGEAGAVLLVTDGAPDGPAAMCGTVDPADSTVLANVAATGLAATPSIKTFVVGLPGVDITLANKIAAAGGSTSAVLVTDASKIEEQFRDALAAVRGKAVPCEIGLPDKVTKGEVSYGLVNVNYTKGGVPPAEGLIQDPTCASGSGWRYDDATKPTKIILCPKTCDEVHADPKAQIDVLLGCATRIK